MRVYKPRAEKHQVEGRVVISAAPIIKLHNGKQALLDMPSIASVAAQVSEICTFPGVA
jgi:hypothetical protein